MSGIIYGIGAGPGASDLLTIRAVNILREIDVLYTPFTKKRDDSVALSIIRPYLNERAQIKGRYFAMSHNSAEKEMIWQSLVKEMEADAVLGLNVAFVTLGDSMLYSTWVSLLERMMTQVRVEIVPGITSYSLIAAQAFYPLAMEEEGLRILSCTSSREILLDAITSQDNLVLMKAGIRFAEIYALLQAHGWLKQAILVSNASLADEVRVMDLSTIDPAIKLPYFSTILLNRSWKKIL